MKNMDLPLKKSTSDLRDHPNSRVIDFAGQNGYARGKSYHLTAFCRLRFHSGHSWSLVKEQPRHSEQENGDGPNQSTCLHNPGSDSFVTKQLCFDQSDSFLNHSRMVLQRHHTFSKLKRLSHELWFEVIANFQSLLP